MKAIVQSIYSLYRKFTGVLFHKRKQPQQKKETLTNFFRKIRIQGQYYIESNAIVSVHLIHYFISQVRIRICLTIAN